MQSSQSIESAETADRPVSVRLLEEVAAREGTDPLDLDPVLYDVLDPDALDTLFDRSGPSVEIEFTYLGYDVVVGADGEITVSD